MCEYPLAARSARILFVSIALMLQPPGLALAEDENPPPPADPAPAAVPAAPAPPPAPATPIAPPPLDIPPATQAPIAAPPVSPYSQAPRPAFPSAPNAAVPALPRAIPQAQPNAMQAQPVAPQAALRPGEVLLNFQAADMQAVVKAISQMTNRNFLLDPRVKGQITIISAKPMSAGTAYQVFLSAIKAQGFTAVESPGAVTRIIPTGEAKLAADVSEKDVPSGGEQIVTQVVVVQHVSATQLVPILRPLMAPTSQLSAYEPANLLIITDYADNVRRLLKIVDKVDLPSTTDVTIVPLVHASALDLAELISRLATSPVATPAAPAPGGAAGSGTDRFSIIPDLRTNSLLVRTENQGRLAQLRSLIAKLDVPAKSSGNTRVIYLRNAEATKIVEVLRGLLAAETRAAQAPAGMPSIPGAARPAGAAARSSAETSLIQADEATNALIISASDAVYNNLRNVIEQLDVRRAQVFVEALIVELTADQSDQLGFQWMGAKERSSGGVVGAVTNFPTANPGIIAASANPSSLAAAGGLNVAFLGEKITLTDGTVIRGLGGLARALENRGLGNVLSTPNLMTLDNAEAKIVVGDNVPFITGSFAQAAGAAAGASVNPFTTIERKDVGLTLKIKPQISEGGTIKLDIYQEVSSVAREAAGLASDLITRKRSVESKVVVDDGHTIVLGGLIEDRASETESAVPLLGRIPLLGALFRYKETNNRKVNLMVFLRPTIVRSAQDGFSVTVDRYNYLRARSTGLDRDGEEVLDRLTPKQPQEKPAAPARETRPAPAATDAAAQPDSKKKPAANNDESSPLPGPQTQAPESPPAEQPPTSPPTVPPAEQPATGQ